MLAIGFAIACCIGLTGVGAGVITAPVLTLFIGLPPAEAVGTALIFSAVVKLALAPLYLGRKQVNFRVLRYLLAGGLPGVMLGAFALERLGAAQRKGPLLAILGATIVVIALLNLFRLTKKQSAAPVPDRARWLPFIALPIGAEVGFSSAGAGALGSLALMTLTPISTAEVIGTDVLFGLGLSLAGGGIHFGTGNYQGAIALKLIAGGLVGAFAGANLSAMLPSRPLRVALSLWLVSLGGQMCWRAVAG
ncbi:MAG: sulfite exporter TauE/SafE family protein [Bryobacteraceae bacterium]